MPRPAAATDAFQAIAEPRRRQIVELLARRGALAVGAIVLALAIPQPAVSKHLAVLRDAGLVTATQQGKQRIYTLNPEELKGMHAWISSFEALWSAQAQRIKRRAEAMAAHPTTHPTAHPATHHPAPAPDNPTRKHPPC
ncbi:MAG: ArsR/SmtB family transcription factor [Phycisphaerales bacterium]